MRAPAGLIWAALVALVAVPLIVAAQSPLLQWREPIYVAAGFAGVIGLVLLPVQALLIAGLVPGVRGRRSHVWIGVALLLAAVVHVAGLWITSPPDVVDVLLLRSPTPFAIWGVAAMWALFAAVLLAAVRRRMGHRAWRAIHVVTTTVIVVGTVVHAVLIEGTMGTMLKGLVGLLALVGLSYAIWRRRNSRTIIRIRIRS
ncbi:ferric reductase-like transmembrane domain-containing protein [Pseudaestuariivita rosea]|uniref:ferric reductase-like transmembrane domain-containing protein n=1 Tax=Pseudaestuariivita rosea TaxID=2763263 RepID=UPI003013BC98